ncbi:MAG TPA: EAL domain-containing protein [Dokdonella sp.]|uniref:bifunctional diguanylate cyclase/phosphodiesterase n=1 Tax=Dokdonella sp. TaxID=2291710 RepID=UPI002BAA217F|nr:EAL domain-containing protein [Dokdonella sp.]HUD40784.1 EAL domain-containing protein [Dokdonella sp.]
MTPEAAHARPSGRTLRFYLVALVLSALVPVLAVGMATVWRAGDQYRQTSEDRLQDTARVLARAAADEIGHAVAILRLLAEAGPRDESSPGFGGADLGTILVIPASGAMREAGLAATVPQQLVRDVLGGTGPPVSNLFFAPGSGQPRVAVAIAHPSAPAGAAALVRVLPPQDLVRMPHANTTTDSSILVAVVDGNGRIVARSRSPERYVGRSVPDWDKLTQLGSDSGLFEAETTEGGDVVFAFHKLQDTPGWVVVVGEPLQVFQARWLQPLLGIIAAVLLAAGVALVFANVIARRVLRPVRALVRHGEETASGRAGDAGGAHEPFPIREFEAMRRSLHASETALRRRVDDAQRLAAMLQASERRYRVVAEAGALVFWRRGADGRVTAATGWEELTGQPEADAVDDGWTRSVHPADLPQVAISWEEAVRQSAPVDVEFRIRDAAGGWRWVRARGAAVTSEDGLEWAGVLEDVDARRQAQARIVYMAHHDALTGLANRILFQEKLEEALGLARRGHVAALLFLDLDRFKEVNDTLGHPTGDALLRAVTARLQTVLRECDIVARLGGDEFAILQADVHQPAAASTLAGRLVEVLRAPYDIDGQQVVIGASVGIAVIDAQAGSVERLLQNADLALYRAKEDGRGCFRFFEPEMDARMQERRRLEIDLRRGLAEGQFQVHYQPLVDLRSNALNGLEALLRWNRPGHGLLLPADFLPLAEEIGLIVPLGAWVLEQACAEAARWPEHVKVAVNLTPMQLARPDLLETVNRALRLAHLAPHRLELEITENALIANIEAASATLLQLKVAGVSIVMDDFGTGYSSLGYLRAFPFDKVKIDKSFVHELGREAESHAIIGAVSHLCTALGITATVEGVETVEQLRMLDREVCHEAQGFLFGEPCPPEGLTELLRRYGS